MYKQVIKLIRKGIIVMSLDRCWEDRIKNKNMFNLNYLLYRLCLYLKHLYLAELKEVFLKLQGINKIKYCIKIIIKLVNELLIFIY